MSSHSATDDLGLEDLGLDQLDLSSIIEEDRPDPLAAVDYSQSPEAATTQEVSEVLKAFKARAKAEQERFRLATDSEYWVAFCFQSREQKEAFLDALSLLQDGDKYIDGVKAAEKFGIALPEVKVPYNTSARRDKKLSELVRR